MTAQSCQLKRHFRERGDSAPLRAIAVDDWSWRKGVSYGTIFVDLEHRTVADVLETRLVKETVDWVARQAPMANSYSGVDTPEPAIDPRRLKAL